MYKDEDFELQVKQWEEEDRKQERIAKKVRSKHKAELLRTRKGFEHMTIFLKDIFVTEEYKGIIKLFGPEEYEYFEFIQGYHDAMMESIEEVLVTLTLREENVFRLRYGFEGNQMHTWTEIAQYYGVSRERIRQIKMKSMRKLRHPSRLNRITLAYKILQDTIDNLINKYKALKKQQNLGMI